MEAFGIRRQFHLDDPSINEGIQGREVIVPRLSVEHVRDDENNNNHIIVNPHENGINFSPLYGIMDECDLFNNNMTLTNGSNFLTISLTSPTSTTVTTSLQTSQHCLRFCHRTSDISQTAVITKTNIENWNNETNKIKADEKLIKQQKEKKKKKKEKPKALRGPSSGAAGRGRGLNEQEQMMKRPIRKSKEKKPEK